MIDVIVPVYGGEEAVRRCIASVLAAPCATPFELIVIDDASPQRSLATWLNELAGTGHVTLYRNPQNRGFVATVNRGMALHPDRDVVLLNSDTEVANDWLDRLARCARIAPDVGTVTPLSNNATICSYPYEGWTGEVPGTLGLAGLDALIARTNPGRSVELPTAVGFCMYIRRDCLDDVGDFDELRFGRGYGEENDFCRRAVQRGWRNLLAADVFVYHRGGVSFGGEREGLMRSGGAALLEAHPEYDKVVRSFIVRDPVRPLREAVDWARAQSTPDEFAAVIAERQSRHAAGWPARRPQPVQLHVSHSWGGGIERWMQDFCAADLVRRNLLLQSRTSRNVSGHSLELVDPQAGGALLMSWKLAVPIAATAVAHREYREIVSWIAQAFGVEAVIVSSLIGHSLDVFDLGVPTAVVLHDFYPFCTGLYTYFGELCRGCSRDDVARCLTSNPRNLFGHVADADACVNLREQYAQKLIACRATVIAPSRSVFDRYAALSPTLHALACNVVPHGLGLPLATDRVRARSQTTVGLGSPQARLRILVLGRLAPHKGLPLLSGILESLLEFADPILLGCGDFGSAFAADGRVTVIVNYANGELPELVAELRPDCALLLSIWPESFSYTLSEMQALAVPVVATRLGAFAERVDDGLTGILVEPDARQILERLRLLHQRRDELQRIAKRLTQMPVRTAAQMVAAYHELLPVGGGYARGSLPAPSTRMISCLGDPDAGGSADTRTALLERELDGAARTVEQLDARVRELEWERDALRASTSWSLTRPLRFLSRAIRAAAGRAAPQAPVGNRGAAPRESAAGSAHGLLREQARERVREWLFLPDSAQIVIGIGEDPDAGLLRFADALENVRAGCPSAYFVWIGPVEDAWRASHWHQVGTPVADRRLFLVGEADRTAWLPGADLYLNCRADPDSDENAPVAAAEGLPVVVAPCVAPLAEKHEASSCGSGALVATMSFDRLVRTLERS